MQISSGVIVPATVKRYRRWMASPSPKPICLAPRGTNFNASTGASLHPRGADQQQVVGQPLTPGSSAHYLWLGTRRSARALRSLLAIRTHWQVEDEEGLDLPCLNSSYHFKIVTFPRTVVFCCPGFRHRSLLHSPTARDKTMTNFFLPPGRGDHGANMGVCALSAVSSLRGLTDITGHSAPAIVTLRLADRQGHIGEEGSDRAALHLTPVRHLAAMPGADLVNQADLELKRSESPP